MEVIANSIQEYSVTTAALAELRVRFEGAKYDVSTASGLETARKDRRELVALRTSLETKRKEIKEPALAHCKLIDEEAKRIKIEIEALEMPIDTIIKAEEARKEEEKAEKARQAAASQKVLDDKILEIGKLPLRCIGKNAEEIAAFVAALEAKEIGGEFTGKTRELAEAAKSEAIAEIHAILHTVVEAEKAEAERKAEQEAEAARLEAERVERERLAAIEREAIEKQQAELAEQKRLNDLEAERLAELSRAENARIEAARQVEQQAADKLKAEQEAAATEIKRQQDELAAKQREEELQSLLIAERKRIEAEKERKAAEKKAKLLGARCKDADTALVKILEICRDETLDGCDALVHIALIAEAMLP
jgi:hypothetical protein